MLKSPCVVLALGHHEEQAVAVPLGLVLIDAHDCFVIWDSGVVRVGEGALLYAPR